MLIDSHHHLWKYSVQEYGWIDDSMAVLQRDFLTEQLRQVAHDSGVDGFVSVQARQTVGETEALLEMASTESLIKGVVGWVPLADENVGEILDRFADQDALKGVRHVVQDEPDDQFFLREDFNRGVAQLASRGLVYDVLIFGRQLPATIQFVRQHSDLPMVLDHIAKPTIASGKMDQQWKTDFCELAMSPNLTCKFSGIATEVRDDAWSIETIRPYFDVALEAFTPDRLMFGSDWPVCLLRTDYQRWLDTVRELTSGLTATEQEKIFSANAIKAYNIIQN